ncbi:DDE-type integrase/transposase/recombinase [Pseudomonas sp. S9]|uniref:DDE-type integrase/transposase/recombinase n=1 Tax=Pseudomonas sp. S9 TaxID=686578 RepID=UPI0002557640
MHKVVVPQGPEHYQQEQVGRFLARRLMKEARLFSSQCRKHRYRKADGESAIAANILDRQFTVSGPNQVWCGDVTYIWAGNRWIYLAAVMDLYARRIVGWALSSRPDSQLTTRALRVAYESRGCPQQLMFHSAQGCHDSCHLSASSRFELSPSHQAR